MFFLFYFLYFIFHFLIYESISILTRVYDI